MCVLSKQLYVHFRVIPRLTTGEETRLLGTLPLSDSDN